MAMAKSVFSTFLYKAPSLAKSSLIAHSVPAASPSFLWAARFATEAKPGAGKGIQKLLKVSPELKAVVGVPEISRPQAIKEIWAYIKARNLQDPSDKRVIVCDQKLKKLFGGKDRVGMLQIAGLVNPHFSQEQ